MRILISSFLTFALAWSAAAQDPAQTLATGVTAYYPFDVNAEDQSGNGYSGIPSAAVSFVPGALAEAISFRSADATVSLPDMGRYATSYSIAAWVNWSAGIFAPGDLRTVVSRLYLQPDTGRLQFYFYYDSQNAADNRSVIALSSGTVPAGSWHHVALVYDGSANELRFYIDGVSSGTSSTPQGIRAQFPWMQAIGSEGRTSGVGAYLNGAVDEVFLYSRALTAAEVQYLNDVRAASGGSGSNMVARGSSSCGNAGQNPCWHCTEHFWWPPWYWGECRVRSPYCIPPAVFRDQNTACGSPPAASAVFGITTLPSTIDIPGYSKLLTGIVGYQAVITNAQAATYVVYDSRTLGVDCGRLAAWIQQTCTGSNSTQCQSLRTQSSTCNSTPPTCSGTGIKDNASRALNYPLYTIQEWQNLYPTRLKINANWFDINGPPNFPYVSPCTDIYGWSVSNGVQVSSPANGNPSGSATEKLDALVVMETTSNGTTTRTLRIVRNSDIAGLHDVKQAVGGFILVKDGKVVNPFPSSTKPTASGARTGVGLSQDGKTLSIVVVQPGPNTPGMTAMDLATYMRITLQAYNVINFDNSGSSQFYYSDGLTTYISLQGDLNQQGQRAWRPIPNFLGIN